MNEFLHKHNAFIVGALVALVIIWAADLPWWQELLLLLLIAPPISFVIDRLTLDRPAVTDSTQE